MADNEKAQTWQELLSKVSAYYKIESEKSDKLAEYLTLLHKWNKAYNLSAVRDIKEMVTRHIADSLSITHYLPRGRLADIGTGAGLPGIPIAIVRDDIDVTLIETQAKRVIFLRQVKQALQLEQLNIIQADVKTVRPEQRFQMVTSRAFASLKNMIAWTEHLLADDGALYPMIGKLPDNIAAEISPYDKTFQLDFAEKLSLPVKNGEQPERHLLKLSPRG